MRHRVDRPGPTDWTMLAVAVLLSAGLLLSGEGRRRSLAATLGRTLLLPYRLALGYGRCPVASPEELDALREQLARRTLDRVQLREALRENDRLRTMLGFAERQSRRLVPAQVVGRSVERFGERLTLAPSGGAAIPGQPVVSTDGLVGCVTDTSGGVCRARTLRHGGLPVSGMLADRRHVGMLRWAPVRRELRMEGVPIQAVVETGTLVLTSGYGGLFPKGLPIGQVVAVRDDS
ncbi:MAG: hypothetical protein GF330_03850, partial [Candidatus Eisenbacteria bacterium]|nr:hypothetical protein [Candidatus Eisenbacteria bacterium]